ncbi:MAG: N-acetyl-gamma-glutamyl-phosphate reductase [Actinobacteria bacterium]|nr:N-acetyl-gamma-glutamyl-phosphate reductase [Actinomycetota bacterium]MBW3649545.1 N-acetyl-gamma-glutamyl-phosphate reductase [Actinomycetota bacterium]
MYPEPVKRIGIVGASGYTGAELLRLCAHHPDLEVAVATGDTQAGKPVGGLYPSLAARYPDLSFTAYEPTVFDGLDLVFLALPHGESQQLVPDLRKRVGKIVDLAADFRLRDASLYPRWYGEEHTAADLLGEFAFGLPELFRDDIRPADLVAAPGCYVTAATLALAPLVRSGAIEASGVIVDAASGASGAGRAPRPTSHFGTVNEDFTAYGLLDHRHTPEMEQAIGAQILFTPHLAPMTRGILATCYARPAGEATPDPLSVLRDLYAGERFIVVSEASPSTKATYGSNCVHLTARYDVRTGWIIVLAALDNLVKGASGQALQCANLVLGLEEGAGLPLVGVYP